MPKLNTLTKLLLALVGIVILFVVIGVLLTASREPEIETENNPTREAPELTEGLVGRTDFGQSPSLELVTSGPLHPASPLLQVGSRVAYQDIERNVFVGQTRLDSVPSVPIRDWVYTADGFLLVDSLSGPLVLSNMNRLENLPAQVVALAPYGDAYRYVEYVENNRSFVIKQSDSPLIGGDAQTLGQLPTTIARPELSIHTVADETYVLVRDVEENGFYEVWQLTAEGARKLLDLSGVKSLRVFADFVLFSDYLETPSDLRDSKINLLDLRDPEKPFVQALNWTPVLGASEIYGEPSADRCDYDASRRLLYCLVKEQDVDSSFEDYRDVLFTYDLARRRIEYPYPTLTFSAARVYVLAGEVYLNLQDTGELYTLIN